MKCLPSFTAWLELVLVSEEWGWYRGGGGKIRGRGQDVVRLEAGWVDG